LKALAPLSLLYEGGEDSNYGTTCDGFDSVKLGMLAESTEMQSKERSDCSDNRSFERTKKRKEMQKRKKE